MNSLPPASISFSLPVTVDILPPINQGIPQQQLSYWGGTHFTDSSSRTTLKSDTISMRAVSQPVDSHSFLSDVVASIDISVMVCPTTITPPLPVLELQFLIDITTVRT